MTGLPVIVCALGAGFAEARRRIYRGGESKRLRGWGHVAEPLSSRSAGFLRQELGAVPQLAPLASREAFDLVHEQHTLAVGVCVLESSQGIEGPLGHLDDVHSVWTEIAGDAGFHFLEQ